jgi:hypothetical protein
MASDLTQPKRHGFITEAGAPDALLPCPTCERPMALDLLHALAAVDEGRLPSNVDVRWTEASHTVPATDGGKRVALECNRCNRRREDAPWLTDRPTYVEGKRAAYREANGRCIASREALALRGYVER